MPYTLRLRVEPADIDELGHANNIVYLRWVQDSAVAHSTAVGLGTAVYLARGQVFMVRSHHIEYLRPALVGDELDVETRVSVLNGASSERRTVIRRVSDGVVMARAITEWVYVDVARARPVRIPAEVGGRFVVEPLSFEGT